jgi:hypothetical protein
MAYAPEFYIPENIIGYTGVLHKNPTVYFLSATHYGHITQVHDDWTNVGREKIRSNTRYFFGNVLTDKRLLERDSGANWKHPSRSPMILVRVDQSYTELTHAIMVHQELKAHQPKKRQAMVITPENLSRRDHPGQQPTKAERTQHSATAAAAAANEGSSLSFQWEKGHEPEGVPENTRLSKVPFL